MCSVSPLVTVLMCVFNDDKFVGQAIESILAQDFNDYEFIIVDDGSTDRTPEILRQYADRDSRIIIHRQANSGTTVAANRGLALARGTFVARLDSDDISFSHRLREEVALLTSNPDVALVGGGAEIIDTAGHVIGVRSIFTRSPVRTLRHRCIYQQSDVMFGRELVVGLGGYREKFRNAQDYDLWLRISEVAKVAKLNQIIGQWRLNGGGYTLSRMAEQKKEVAVIKRMAASRRAGFCDGYERYVPAPAPIHRKPIGPNDYNLVLAGVLLKSLRVDDARRLSRDILRFGVKLRPLVLFSMTFFPRWVLRACWGVREMLLNRFT